MAYFNGHRLPGLADMGSSESLVSSGINPRIFETSAFEYEVRILPA